jgi:type I restriction enzyme S subunit
MGQAPDGESYNDTGLGLPLIAGAGDFGVRYPQPKKFTSAPTKLCGDGDIVLSIRATIGTKVLSNGKFCLGRGVAGLRPTDALDSRYLWHWLGNAESALASKGRGATFPQVSRSDIGELEIPLPSFDEQRRIAAILDKADALRCKREQAIELVGAASDSFIEFSIERFAGRKVQSLGGCLEFMTTGGRNWSQYYADTGSRFIRSLDVQMNSISNEDVVLVDAPENAEAKRTRTRAGDVLLTVTGSRIGRVAALPQELAGAYISQHVAILRPNARRLRPKFLSYFLSSQSGQRQIAKWQYGQTKPGLNFKQIESFEIPEIDADKQLGIESAIASFEHSAKMLRVQRAKFDSLFSSLQHRAFSGQL